MYCFNDQFNHVIARLLDHQIDIKDLPEGFFLLDLVSSDWIKMWLTARNADYHCYFQDFSRTFFY